MTDTALAANDQNLVWIDLEMTGLYPDRDRIIEIAVVVTDAQLGRRTQGPVFAIHQSDATLDAMENYDLGGYAVGYRPNLRSGSRFVELSIITGSGRIRQ